MKEIANHETPKQEVSTDAPGYAWIIVTFLLLAVIFLPIVIA
jgi:hypothetical protein